MQNSTKEAGGQSRRNEQESGMEGVDSKSKYVIQQKTVQWKKVHKLPTPREKVTRCGEK